MACVCTREAPADSPDRVVFGTDVRPILADVCFRCHGPDEETREAGLRLDIRKSAKSDLDSGNSAIVPGNPDASELYRRITATDDAERMPPASSAKQLAARQIEVLRRWIEQGAEWDEHWSFRAPAEDSVPPVADHDDWVRNDIDRFVLRRLQTEGLAPSPAANRERLLRRVTFDLTGLPPTPEELDRFLADRSSEAWDRMVDRLLDSPAYGERMALEWLDAARYADTHGYMIDAGRQMWRWRDWVISAFNSNMPFDQFTIEQLAGDLLPQATIDQNTATGFNRNHTIQAEFGSVPEEFLVEYVCDRVNTMGTVWMGLSLECARCHDHKYDPLTQKEYYRLFAFFDQTGENGVDGYSLNAAPVVRSPTQQQIRQLQAINGRLALAEARVNDLQPHIDVAQKAWEETSRPEYEDFRDGLIHYWRFDGDLQDAAKDDALSPAKRSGPSFESGVFGKSIVSKGLNPKIYPGGGILKNSEPFTLSTWIYMKDPQGRGGLFARMRDGTKLDRGYTFQILADGRLALVLAHDYPQDCVEVESEGKDRIVADQWHHAAITYDGSSRASGVKMYINGRPQTVRVLQDCLTGSFEFDGRLLLMDGTPSAALRGMMDEARIYGRALDETELQQIAGISIHSLLAVPVQERTCELSQRIREHFVKYSGRSEWTVAFDQLNQIRRAKAKFEKGIPTVMVMQEPDKPGETHMLVRGQYDQPGESVSPGTPAIFPPMPDDVPKNRVGLARWLVSGAHPLTARVAVNRFWQMYFGVGLVKTTEEFGSQGQPPSHPDLLDWLAGEFVRSGWDVRAMQRLIVTSTTYRQSSLVGPDLLKRDPENRLLARGPRFRLHAEFIRDQALTTSGLLSFQLGGPSVKPYQPTGVWKESAYDSTGNRFNAQVYEQDRGAALYRRSLYTYWKRTAPPPSMMIFDAADRHRSCVKRTRTNTPLQALVLMNAPQFVEASRKLAERMMEEGGTTVQERIQFGFRLLTSRRPSVVEQDLLLTLFEKQQDRFVAHPQAAAALLSVGESPHNESFDAVDLAAYSTVGSVILNLDETLTKN